MKVEQTVFAELDMGSKKKNSTVFFFNLGIWENEGAITEMIEIISGTGLCRKIRSSVLSMLILRRLPDLHMKIWQATGDESLEVRNGSD